MNARAREQYGRIISWRAEGKPITEIAARLGCSVWLVKRILIEFGERVAHPEAAAELAALDARRPFKPKPVPAERPAWSYPSQELLELARLVREEIARAEGFARPLV